MDFDKAWEGIKDIFKGVWNTIIDLLNGAINIIIRGLNWLIKQMNKISFDVPSWVPAIGGKSIGVNISYISENVLPHLAKVQLSQQMMNSLLCLAIRPTGTTSKRRKALFVKLSGRNPEVPAKFTSPSFSIV